MSPVGVPDMVWVWVPTLEHGQLPVATPLKKNDHPPAAIRCPQFLMTAAHPYTPTVECGQLDRVQAAIAILSSNAVNSFPAFLPGSYILSAFTH